MDSKKLNAEQLKQLVKFIHSRGFKENVVVLEILDHFACKIEEIIEQQPTLAFETAITTAHESFGVMGFKPIAEAFHEQIKMKYARLYWKYFKAIVSKPLAVLLLPLTAVLYFTTFMWAEQMQYRHVININDVLLGAMILYIALELMPLSGLGKNERRHPFIQYSMMGGRKFWASGIVYGLIDDIHNPEYVWVTSVYSTVLFVYVIVRYLATVETIRRAKEDIDAIELMAIS